MRKRTRWERTTCYSGFVSKKAQHIPPPHLDPAESPPFEELAAEQGVTPVGDFQILLGKPAPGDESVEEFSSMLREGRREGDEPSRVTHQHL